MAHDAIELKDMIIQLQDGSRLNVERSANDELIGVGYEPAAGTKTAASPVGLRIIGFGPWPTWSTNVSNRTNTVPDEESGLFEPERLFVLREQYAFFAGQEVDPNKPLSFGPIHKAWWVGTENIVQARRGGWH